MFRSWVEICIDGTLDIFPIFLTSWNLFHGTSWSIIIDIQHLAAIWATASSNTEKRSEKAKKTDKPTDLSNSLPTPSHFTRLVGICAGVGLKSVLEALSTSFRSSSQNPHRGLLYIALRAILPLLVLAYAISVVEGIWLHAVTLPRILPVEASRSPSNNLQLSRSIDNAQGAVDILRGSNEAILTANNLSTTNTVRLISETAPQSSLGADATPSTTTALLLPYLSSDTQAILSYKATTTGVRTTCENLTPYCNIHVEQPDDSAETGSVLYDCPGIPGLTQGISATNTAFGPNAGWNITQFDPSAVDSIVRGQSSNPFPVALAMIFNADLQDDTDNTTPQLLGGMVHTRGPRLFGLLWCQVEVLAPVTYQNNRGFIEVLDAQRAGEGSPEVWAISGGFTAARLSSKVYTDGQASPLGPASNRSVSFTSAYSRAVANVFLSTSAGVHTSASSIEERDIKLVQATYIPWSVLGVFFGLVVAFTAFATWICWDVWRSARISVTKNDLDDGQLLETGAERLSEGGTLIYDILGSKGSEEEMTKMSAMRIRLGTRKDGGYGVSV
ncbi:hypothetical protein BT69DRAFT_1353797 [Atractiella rhizophila]|nr:hypothetical protein BT69DRAFT_1353797 [Atractiella rhizophila]